MFLKDIWPSNDEIAKTVTACVTDDMFKLRYSDVFKGDDNWAKLQVAPSERYAWDPKSEYVKQPPYFENMPAQPAALARYQERARARRVRRFGHDRSHLAGRKHREDLARGEVSDGARHRAEGLQLVRRAARQSRSDGARHVRQRALAQPAGAGRRRRRDALSARSNEQMSIFDAAMKYKAEGTPLIVLAGKEYGSGSSRDWAAKGPYLLGIKAVIAESFERIHRSNLIGMGILPLRVRRRAPIARPTR